MIYFLCDSVESGESPLWMLEHCVMYHLLELIRTEPMNRDYYIKVWSQCNIQEKEPNPDIFNWIKEKTAEYTGVNLL